jgi:hypothetical protein
MPEIIKAETLDIKNNKVALNVHESVKSTLNMDFDKVQKFVENSIQERIIKAKKEKGYDTGKMEAELKSYIKELNTNLNKLYEMKFGSGDRNPENNRQLRNAIVTEIVNPSFLLASDALRAKRGTEAAVANYLSSGNKTADEIAQTEKPVSRDGK